MSDTKDKDILLETALEAIEMLTKKVEAYDAKFAALETNTSLVVAPAKKKALVDPGIVKIDKKSYRFTSLRFSATNTVGDIVKMTAEDVVNDASLLAHLLAKHPSLFEEA